MANKPTNKTRKVGKLSPELIATAVLAALFLASLTLVSVFLPAYAAPVGAGLFVLYAATFAVMQIWSKSPRGASDDEEVVSPYLGDIMTDTMMNLAIPSAICSEGGVIIWNNTAFRELADGLGLGGKLRGKQLSSILPIEISSLDDAEDNVRVEAADRILSVTRYRFRVNGKPFYMLTIHDRTEPEQLRAELRNERTLIAHIQIDNLSELSEYGQGEYRDAGRDVDAILKSWARGVGAIIREYDHSKYIMMFREGYIDEFTAHKFDVLDRVREVRVGAGMLPVTVSIGISLVGASLSERERASYAALDTALQRGGDQVVLRTDSGTEFYGGRTKTTQKRTKVRSRVIATELAARISRAGNVLIMGHRYPDFDCIGASIGAARLAMREGADVHIIIDTEDDNIRPCIEHVRTIPEYSDMFVDEATALDMIRSDTLVIICDVNSYSHLAAPNVANSAPETVVIDHHIKTADPPKEAVISYIEPSASSTCELVSEMLEQLYQSNGVVPAEADVMYAGILLDTKHLSRSTTSRTFSAAMYLQGCGANPEVASDFFRAGLDDFTSEARFESNVTIYRGEVAISCSSEQGKPGDRVAAAKAADKLLTVRGVNAAFAAVRIDDTVHISARSSGSINVQIILEKLGGGGHFDVAGAQLKNSELDAALKKLKGAIDDYFDEIKVDAK